MADTQSAVDAYRNRRRCSVPGCTGRVKGRFRMCRLCRAYAALRKAASRARGPSASDVSQAVTR